jgi:putative SOS response-associated peptidase YedK
MSLTRADLRSVAAELGAEVSADDVERHRARYNLAPTDLTWLLVDHDGMRRLVPSEWGLPGARRVINVRGENVARGAFAHHRRVAIVVDGFYEWAKAPDGTRRAFWFHDAAGQLLLIAAVDAPLAASTKGPTACCLITTRPNAEVKPVHNRMPVILPAADVARWLGGGELPKDLLKPFADGGLEGRPVSSWVNSVRHDDARCIQRYDGLPDESRSSTRTRDT